MVKKTIIGKKTNNILVSLYEAITIVKDVKENGEIANILLKLLFLYFFTFIVITQNCLE